MNNASKKTFALFPGQGSQAVGMGKELSEKFGTAAELFAQADQVLGFSLSKICFDGPLERLTATEIVQPAILTVSTICHKLASEESGDALQICAAAGHSLGEYSALVAAGAIKFNDAVLLVHKRGRYMQEAVPKGEGKMLAVLGKELEQINEVISKIEGIIQVANINAPGQVVVSGQAQAVDCFQKEMGTAKMIELTVSAPFHSALMQPAAEKLAADLDQLTINPANFPIYANFSAKAVSDPEEIRQSLKDQVCGQVRWTECVSNAIEETSADYGIEFGCGNVLQGLLKRINRKFPKAGCGSVEDIEQLSGKLAVE